MATFQDKEFIERRLAPTYRHYTQRAMVSAPTNHTAFLWVDGRPGVHEVKLTSAWRSIQSTNEQAPPWIHEGALYSAREDGVETAAEIIRVQSGWVAFWNHLQDYPEVFRLVTLEFFTDHWKPCTNPTAWDRIEAGLF